jgi:hypothetical protein
VDEDDRGEENAEGGREGFILRKVQSAALVVAGCEGKYLFSVQTKARGWVVPAPAQCPCPVGDDRRQHQRGVLPSRWPP